MQTDIIYLYHIDSHKILGFLSERKTDISPREIKTFI